MIDKSLRQIQDEQDDPEDDPPLSIKRVEEMRRLLGGAPISAATGDSIFSAYRDPVVPIRYESLGPRGNVGSFNLRRKDIIINSSSPGQTPMEGEYPLNQYPWNRIPHTLTHEMAHELSAAEQFADGGSSDEFQAIRDRFASRYSDLDYGTKRRLMEDYYGSRSIRREESGELNPSGDDIGLANLFHKVGLRGFRTAEMEEMFANSMGRGYRLARKANAADPLELEMEVADKDAVLPGTRDAFNYFIDQFESRSTRMKLGPLMAKRLNRSTGGITAIPGANRGNR